MHKTPCIFSLEANVTVSHNQTTHHRDQDRLRKPGRPPLQLRPGLYQTYQYSLYCLLTVVSPPIHVVGMGLTTRATPGSWSAVVVSLQQTPAICHDNFHQAKLMPPTNIERLAVNSYFYINTRTELLQWWRYLTVHDSITAQHSSQAASKCPIMHANRTHSTDKTPVFNVYLNSSSYERTTNLLELLNITVLRSSC